MLMWNGRFTKELDSKINDFNSSISFDHVMYQEDILGSMAHAKMLGETGIIDKTEAEAIVEGLQGILEDIQSGALLFDPNAEDIHMFVEEVLTQRIGDTGKRLHTARSRNDQVALDIKMYLKTKMEQIKAALMELTETVIQKSEENLHTVMPGYTHLQIAQPVTFAHHLMAYCQMFLRDLDRLKDCYGRTDVIPLGSGALAATTYPIDREMVAKELGFSAVTANSMDGVSDRDYCMELAGVLSILMVHLSRFCEEIILWCSSEFKFIELDDAFATGSSIMPQKKNPDIAELIRGKAGRVFGNLTTLLTMMKGIPLAYDKDMQEDKQAIFDSIETVLLCIGAFTPMLKTITVNKTAMEQAAQKGFINATDCADYLVKHGMPFREAHHVSGSLVRLCIEKNCTLDQLPLEEYKAQSSLFEEDIYTAISVSHCVAQRKVLGGPAPEAVKVQILQAQELLAKLK